MEVLTHYLQIMDVCCEKEKINETRIHVNADVCLKEKKMKLNLIKEVDSKNRYHLVFCYEGKTKRKKDKKLLPPPYTWRRKNLRVVKNSSKRPPFRAKNLGKFEINLLLKRTDNSSMVIHHCFLPVAVLS